MNETQSLACFFLRGRVPHVTNDGEVRRKTLESGNRSSISVLTTRNHSEKTSWYSSAFRDKVIDIVHINPSMLDVVRALRRISARPEA